MTANAVEPSLPTTRLIFLRHGKADGVEGRCVGHFDAPLSASGATDIGALEWSVAGETRIISSDLRRALQSAQIVAQKLGVAVSTDSRLREMNFGEWDGRLWSELEAVDLARLSAWMEHWTDAAPPHGESVGDLVARVKSWLCDTLNEASNTDRTLIVVAHAGTIRVALCVLNEIPIGEMFDIAVEHATPMSVDFGVGPQGRPSV